MIEEGAPSHPTRKQLSGNPSEDYLGSRALGGARLSATVSAFDTAIVMQMTHEYYPSTLRTASASGAAWADAHLAIGQFADKLARFCRDRP